MLEEAAGTRLYETKKQQAYKTIEKKQNKLQELDSVSLFHFCSIVDLSSKKGFIGFVM